MRADGTLKTVTVVLGVCLACSFLVSTAAVKLYGLQQENQRLDRIRNILIAGGLFEPGADIAEVYRTRVEPVLIDLRAGTGVDPERLGGDLSIEAFDIATWATHPDLGEAIPPHLDRARLQRRPRYMAVYRVEDGEGLDKVILPICGKGLWSTLYGFLALEKDIRTVAGITFYAHGETPGLGGEVDNPRWKQSWKGKQAFDAAGNVVIGVAKGQIEPQAADAVHRVDGLSGATITSRGVDNLIKYWLGEDGYGPFLARLREAT